MFMRTIDKIITKVDVSRGAPMGRFNVGEFPYTVTKGKSCKIFKCHQKKIFDCRVNLSEGYDKGGAYWGIGAELRVRYTKDLSFIHFYRVGDDF